MKTQKSKKSIKSELKKYVLKKVKERNSVADMLETDAYESFDEEQYWDGYCDSLVCLVDDLRQILKIK